MARRTALVTGVSGQDGIYLAQRLRARDDAVLGTVRPGDPLTAAMRVYLEGVELVELDVRDDAAFATLLEDRRPDRVFNLAGFSSVGASWDQPDLVMDVNGAAVERMLDAVVRHCAKTGEEVRFFQAGSAEELGSAAESPYAQSKQRARAAVVRARETHALHACTATLHNHESPLRPTRFVTRKITRAAAEISRGRRDHLTLGNLDVTRDWGWAGDHVDAMCRMVELDEPTDLVVATGVNHTLHDLLDVAFAAAGLADVASYVTHDVALLRPADAATLSADISQTRDVLGWEPSLTFADVVEHMVLVDLQRLHSGVEESVDYLSPAQGS